MKRTGYVYEQMAVWENIVEAEKVSTRRKMRNPGVLRHVGNRWSNLVEIQQMVLEGRMRTDEYQHEKRISGQDKLRDIAKLHFHPSHIEHQLLTMAGDRRIDRTFIRHTYASRKGYGQIACALHIKKLTRKYRGVVRWYGQGDVCKYYDSILHCFIRKDLERLFKDKKFVDAFMEPFERFSKDGKRIPLGIRPSQSIGNLELSEFDHFMLEENKAEDYLRYLDDFLFTGATKGEVKRKMKRADKFLAKRGLKLHVPKIHRIEEGIDMMGFVYYGVKNDMFLRKSDKKRWLKHRSRVTNKKRIKELDDAAWGLVKWGNSHCKRLWCKVTGNELPRRKDMGVKINKTGIKRTEHTDAKGIPFIEEPKIGMEMLIKNGRAVECDRWLKGIKTSHGEGRYALRIRFMGEWYKLIVNATEIKNFLDDMDRNKVSHLMIAFKDDGSRHYSVNDELTEILEVDGRKVTEWNGKAVFEDTGEEVVFQ